MRFLMRVFPKKTHTLQEFIDRIKSAGVSSVSITPMIDRNFNSVLTYETETEKGRRIVYRDIITERNGGLGTALAFCMVPGSIQRETIRLCLAGEERVKELQRKLPKMSVFLTFEGKVMESFDELHRNARAHHLF